MINASGSCFVQFIARLVLITFAVFVPAHACAGSMKKTGKPLPSALIGTWQVVKVNVDTKATRKLNYQYDDPRLKGRIFWITKGNLIQNTPENITCVNPTVTSNTTTSGKLIKDSMGWRGIEPEIPIPEDFELPLTVKKTVQVLNIGCKDGLWGDGVGRADGIDNAWMIALPKGQMALRWYGETILILERLPANSIPKPSFNCSKATTPTEKAICGSLELASFDLSVAESYKQNIRGFTAGKDPSAVKRVKASQKAWIKKRDTCGSNATCLKKTMEEQLEVLGDLEKFYNPE